MERKEVIDKLRQFVLQEILEGETQELDEKTPLLSLGVIDSLSLLRLLGFIEEEFGVGVQIESLDLDCLRDLDSLARLVTD